MNFTIALLLVAQTAVAEQGGIKIDGTLPIWGIFLFLVTYAITFVIFVIKIWNGQSANTSDIKKLNEDLAKLKSEATEDKKSTRSLIDNEIKNSQEKHETQMKNIKELHDKELASVRERFDKEIENIRERNIQMEKSFHHKIDREITSLKDDFKAQQDELIELSNKMDSVKGSVGEVLTKMDFIMKYDIKTKKE